MDSIFNIRISAGTLSPTDNLQMSPGTTSKDDIFYQFEFLKTKAYDD